MKLSIRHDTTYSYADEVCTSIQFLRLTPRDTQRQRILEWHLELPRLVRSQVDPYGNILHVMTMDEPHGALVLTAYGQVEIDQTVEMEGDSQSPLPFLRTSRLTQADDVLSAFAVEQCGARRDRAALTDLMNGLAARMPYSPGTTAVNSTAAEAFAGERGVPGPHPCVPGLRAQPGDPGPLRLRLPVHRRRKPPGEPRLGGSLAGRRLVQLRRDQPPDPP